MKEIKILRTLVSFFFSVIFPRVHTYIYTQKHSHTRVQVVYGNPIPLDIVLNSGILEGWKYFFKITMVLKMTKGGPFSVFLFFLFFQELQVTFEPCCCCTLNKFSVITSI